MNAAQQIVEQALMASFRDESTQGSGHERRKADSTEVELTVDDNPRTYRVSMLPLPDSDEAYPCLRT